MNTFQHIINSLQLTAVARCIKLILATPVILGWALLCGACSDTLEVEPQTLVIDGQISSNGYPEVYLSMTVNPTQKKGNLSEVVVRWGVITISDGETEAVLTGRVHSSTFPQFVYYTYDLKGTPGRTYTIRAEYAGKTATATAKMLTPTPITAVNVTKVGTTESLRNITLHFTAPTDNLPAYYHASCRVYDIDGRFYPSMLSTIEVTTPGADVEMPVYRGHSIANDEDYESSFNVGQVVGIRLERITKEVFDFWRAYDNAGFVNSSAFLGNNISLPSNIVNGHGVWSAQAVADTIITIK